MFTPSFRNDLHLQMYTQLFQKTIFDSKFVFFSSSIFNSLEMKHVYLSLKCFYFYDNSVIYIITLQKYVTESGCYTEN